MKFQRVYFDMAVSVEIKSETGNVHQTPVSPQNCPKIRISGIRKST